MSAQLHSLQVSQITEIAAGGTDAWWDKPWTTSFYKQAVTHPLWLGYEGLRGDQQADRRYHGGADKAVCVYPLEHYADWRASLGLPEMSPGAFGENFTTTGLVEAGVCIGDVFAVGRGDALVQISQPRQPCWKLARRWRVKDLTAQVERTGRTGFYFRVLQHGEVGAGDAFTLLERPFPQWTVGLANELMHHRRDDHAAAQALASCPALSASWKDSLWSRAQTTAAVQEAARKARQNG